VAVATELGVGYLSILPDFSKLPGAVSKGFGAAAKGAAQVFSRGIDKNLTGVSKSFAKAGKDAGEALAKSALAAAKADVAKLSKTVSGAADKQADALGRLRVAETRLADARAAASKTTSKVQTAEANLAKLRASEETTAEQLAAAESALEKARAGATSAATRLTAAEESQATAKRKSNTASAAAKTASEGLTKAQLREKEAAEALGKAQSDAAAAAKSGSRFGKAFTGGFKSLFSPKQVVDESLGRIDGGKSGRLLATRFGAGFNGVFGGVVSKSAALLAATFATVGIGGLVADSVNLEATFSQTMNTMAAVAKVPASGIKSLSDLALKMGADTTFSASEAATAMLELAKGGLSAATIQSGALQGTLTLAAAGGTDLATASTIASNALNTFGLEGKDMASVAAALAGGANASSASVESLGEALGQVGPGATNAGLSLQDTVGVLSAFDAAGIKGSDAGTSLKTMLTNLVPQTKKAALAMEGLGLKFTDAQGNFVPITNVAEQLRQKLGSLSEEERTTALSTIFGSDATRAATVLMKDGAAGIGKYIAATKDQNAANEVAAARMAGTAGAIEQFKGSVETAKLQLGQFLAPAVQAGLGKLTTLVNGIAPTFTRLGAAIKSSGVGAALLSVRDTASKIFTEIRGSFLSFVSGFTHAEDGFTTSGIPGFFERLGITARKVIDSFRSDVIPVVKTVAGNLKNDLLPPLSSVAGTLLDFADTIVLKIGPAFSAFTGFLRDNVTLVGAIATGVLAMVAAYKAYQLTLVIVSAVTKAFAVVQAILNAVMAANVFAVVALALIGIAAGLIYAYKHSEKFRSIVNGVFAAVKGVVLTAIDAIRVGIGALVIAFKAVKGAIGTAFDAVKSAVSTAVDFIKDHWKLIVAIIGGPIVAIVLLVTTYWKQIKAGFQAGISAVVGALKTAWGAIVNVFSGPVKAVIGVLGAIWSRIYPILVLPFYIANAAIAKIWSLIQAGFNAAVAFVRGAFAAAWAFVEQTIIAPLNKAWHAIVYVWDLIRAGFTAAKDWVITQFSKAWSAVSGVLSGPINTAKTWIGQRFADIQARFTAAKDWVVGAFAKAWGAVTRVLSKAVDDGKSAISTVFGKIQGAFTSAKDWVTSTFAKAWGAVKEKLTKPISDAKDAIGHFLSAEKNGLQNIFSTAVSSIGKIWDGLQDLAKKPVKFIIETVLNEGLIGGFNWIADKFKAPTIKPIPMPKGFAGGGPVTGPGTETSDSINARLSKNEFVEPAKAVRHYGPGLFEALRHRAIPREALPGFKDGGLFGKLKGAVTGAFNAGKSFGSDAIGFLSDPVKWFKDRMSGPLGRLSELGNSPIAETVKAVPRNLADTVVGKAKDLLGFGGGGSFNAGLTGALDFARSQAGKPYIWGSAGPVGYDCSGFISALVNVALGRAPYNRLFSTASMPAGVFEPGPGAFSVSWFRGNPGHTAGTINGTNVESRGGQGVVVGPSARGASNGLFNAGIWHLPGFAKGGLVGDGPFDELDPRGKAFKGKALLPSSALAFDSGQGQLPEGWSAVFNGTGAPEPLTRTDRAMDLSDEAIDKLAAAVALRNARLDVRDVDNVLIGSMQAQAKKVQNDTAGAMVHEHLVRD
jgi:TP901 family phage tail tape measure protein